MGEWVKSWYPPELETKSCSVGCNFCDVDGAVYQGYANYNDDNTVDWYSYEHRGYIKNVTHWMPLPEPPKDTAN